MKKLAFVRILSVLLMVFVSLAAAAPAYADTPVHLEGFADLYNPIFLCDFEIEEHLYGNYVVNQKLDENNLPTREIYAFNNLKGDWSANGKTVNVQIDGPVHLTYTYYPVVYTVSWKTIGAGYIITVPGYGKIWGGAGQILETFTYTYEGDLVSYHLDDIVGNWAYDLDALCAYLGP